MDGSTLGTRTFRRPFVERILSEGSNPRCDESVLPESARHSRTSSGPRSISAERPSSWSRTPAVRRVVETVRTESRRASFIIYRRSIESSNIGIYRGAVRRHTRYRLAREIHVYNKSGAKWDGFQKYKFTDYFLTAQWGKMDRKICRWGEFRQPRIIRTSDRMTFEL